MVGASFFDEQEEQSRVKTEIVLNYFTAWATVMLGQQHVSAIRYLDLYSGPGQYRSGELSTPLLILRSVVNSPSLRARVQLIFNDHDDALAINLRRDVESWPNLATVAYTPIVTIRTVDDTLIDELATLQPIPTLSFVDPWGYRGVSRRLLQVLIKEWGSEAILFFNYNRINPAIENSAVEHHMEALFGPERVAALRRSLPGQLPSERERMILRAIGESISELGAQHLIPFRFVRPGGRPSHYILFATKNHRGYAIMKDIMARAGIVDADGVPRFEYLPMREGQQLALNLDRPIVALADSLLTTFARQTLTMQQIFDRHNIGTPFVKRNYKRVLLELEAQGRITTVPAKRPKRTFADHVRVSFP
ncbi:MAG: three-Cys-motif partner protein TcmP [Dehalococcoidia bacterium]